jgi:hypothetical protein
LKSANSANEFSPRYRFGEGALDEKSLAERGLPCHYWAGIGRIK